MWTEARIPVPRLVGQEWRDPNLSLIWKFFPDSVCQSCKDSSYISTFLHRDDPKLIFLIDPGQECLFCVVEDSTTFGPITLHTSSDQVFVTRDEQEVIINKLLACLLIHSQKWVVVSSQITREFSESTLHEFLNSNSLVFGDSRGETKSFNATPNTDSG